VGLGWMEVEAMVTAWVWLLLSSLSRCTGGVMVQISSVVNRVDFHIQRNYFPCIVIGHYGDFAYSSDFTHAVTHDN